MLKFAGRWALVLGLITGAPWVGAAEPTDASHSEQIRKLPWQTGPGKGAAGSRATVTIPADGQLLPESDGAKFLELTGNLPEPGHTVMVTDTWWAVFSFQDAGYIKDDEKLDAAALLENLKDSDEGANEERRKLGITQLHTVGWIVPPHYDEQTKHLEWGLRLRADGATEDVVNYTVRLLGRTGYESVTLVSTPADLQKSVAELKTVLNGFNFNSGEQYAEFKQGDRIAEIGLGALVLGGAAAAAVKTGFWKTILVALAASWKVVLGSAVGVIAGIRRLFRKGKPQ